MPSSRGSSQPRDQTCITFAVLAGRFYTTNAPGKPYFPGLNFAKGEKVTKASGNLNAAWRSSPTRTGIKARSHWLSISVPAPLSSLDRQENPSPMLRSLLKKKINTHMKNEKNFQLSFD